MACFRFAGFTIGTGGSDIRRSPTVRTRRSRSATALNPVAISKSSLSHSCGTYKRKCGISPGQRRLKQLLNPLVTVGEDPPDVAPNLQSMNHAPQQSKG